MLELLQTLTGLFVVIYDGQHALKFTLGRAKGVVGPGVHFKIPILQKFVVKDTRHTTLDLQPQVIQLADDLIFEVDAKVVYQVTDVFKAIVQIDDLVTGMQNRVVIAIQEVIRKKNRSEIANAEALCAEIVGQLKEMEEAWGVSIVQFGFSNLSPSPATLEITQLDLLAREKLTLLKYLESEGLRQESAVALLSGAVVSLGYDDPATA